MSKRRKAKHKSACSRTASSPSELFPFQRLPVACKYHVFSYLTSQQKCSILAVCKEWNQLLRSPSLWQSIDLNELTASATCSRHLCSEVCYLHYYERVKHFLLFLQRIQLNIRQFQFDFDFAETNPLNWFALIFQFCHAIPLHSLERIQFNWRATKNKPFSMWYREELNHIRFDTKNCHRNLLRRRLLLFLKKLVLKSPNIRAMSVPFMWSSQIINVVGQFSSLTKLHLQRDTVFQLVPQALLDKLFSSLPQLTRLRLSSWCPSDTAINLYSIRSRSLKILDISESRGFFIKSFEAPHLGILLVGKYLWNGPLVAAENWRRSVPCLKHIIDNTPSLVTFNEVHLRHCSADDLESVFKGVCPCKVHRKGWAM